jgi:hypothetical protein
VERPGYEIDPATREVRVEGGRTVRAGFALTLAFTGAVAVAAVDEVRGTAVEGAEILVDVGAGFAPSGVLTPGTVAGLPPGPARVATRKTTRSAGFADSPPVSFEVVVAETAQAATVLGPPRAVLAEMFTYVVCPNCPEAAEKLEELHLASPGRVFVIEWHTVSPLPLYDARWRARESYYGGGSSVGWPATVFQGGAGDNPVLVVGSDAADLQEYEDRTAAALERCGNDCPLALVVDGAIGATTASATVKCLWRGGALPADLRLRAVLIENHVQAPGNQPYFSFVARAIEEWTSEGPLAFAAPGDVVERTTSLPVDPTWDVDELHVVAFVQSDATREILAVGGLP